MADGTLTPTLTRALTLTLTLALTLTLILTLTLTLTRHAEEGSAHLLHGLGAHDQRLRVGHGQLPYASQGSNPRPADRVLEPRTSREGPRQACCPHASASPWTGKLGLVKAQLVLDLAKTGVDVLTVTRHDSRAPHPPVPRTPSLLPFLPAGHRWPRRGSNPNPNP